MKISFSIITFNEEKNIQDCITSFYELADEIVILDSFSQDETEKISRSFGKVRFYQQKFLGHIAQKNSALDLCKNDWVFCLDADERLSEQLKQNILTLQHRKNINGYKVSRLTYHLNQYIRFSGWYPNYRYRFVNRHKARWTGEDPHDYIILEGQGRKIKGDIVHYSFKDLSHQINTINRFSSIVALKRFEKKKKFSRFKMVFKPIVKFLEIYIYKLGFLDGWSGFIIAYSSSFATFLKFAKLYELKKRNIQISSGLDEK